MKTLATLILAAGASSRLGKPKQLLKFNDKSFIQKITEEAITAGLQNIYVITGYEHEAVAKELTDLPVNVFYNDEWEEGMGSSLRNGLKHALAANVDIQAILILLCDQPFVDAGLIKKIVSAYSPDRQMIIASGYAGTFGVPVLVDQYYFPMLAELKGDEGGKKIFAQYLQNIVEIPFPKGSVDIDELSDLENLKA